MRAVDSSFHKESQAQDSDDVDVWIERLDSLAEKGCGSDGTSAQRHRQSGVRHRQAASTPQVMMEAGQKEHNEEMPRTEQKQRDQDRVRFAFFLLFLALLGGAAWFFRSTSDDEIRLAFQRNSRDLEHEFRRKRISLNEGSKPSQLASGEPVTQGRVVLANSLLDKLERALSEPGRPRTLVTDWVTYTLRRKTVPRPPAPVETRPEFRQLEEIIYETLAGLEKTRGPGHPETLQGYLDLGQLYQGEGLYEQAEPVLRYAMSAAVASIGVHHPLTILIAENYVSVLGKMGRSEDAARLARQFNEWRE